MDLIYTNANHEDLGVLPDYELDLAFGLNENNFECRIVQSEHCCEPSSLLYFEGTEYGGIIDSIESDSGTNEVVYTGRTWHGILDSKILQPDSGQDYLVLNGEANTVLSSIITRIGLQSLFEASSAQSGLTFTNYKVARYATGYSGIIKALKSLGAKLRMAFKNGKVILSAVPVHDYSDDGEIDADVVPIKVVKNYNTINHLICLGSGELASRLVVHLYADAEGNISQTQTFTGLAEVVATYEYSQISTAAEMIVEGTKHFKDLISTGFIDVDFNATDDIYEVGDIIGSYDNFTGIFVAEVITKKIISMKHGVFSVDYSTKTESVSSVVPGGSGGGTGDETDPTVPSFVKAITQEDIAKWNSALTSETDPTVPAHVKSITQEEIAKWNASGGVKFDLLWTNPTPTTSMSAKTVNLDVTGEYPMFLLLSRYSASDGTWVSSIMPNGQTGRIQLVGSTYQGSRMVTINGSTATFGAGTYNNTSVSNSHTDNNYAIPVYIYGIKI